MSSTTKRAPVRLMENFRSPFYTPLYVALSGGFFEAEGLDVAFSTAPVGYHALDALYADLADIFQGGPMRSLMASDGGAKDVPLHFIEINSRDGFFLVRRGPQREFQWSDLIGASLIPLLFSPLPKASLKYALKKKGVKLEEVRLIDGLPIQEATDAFRREEADFIHSPQFALEELLQEGVGHLVASLGPVIGHVSFSSFMASQSFLAAEAEVVQRFTLAFYNAQRWLAENDASAVADAIGPYFPEVEKSMIVRTVERYKAQDTWARDPLLREDGFNTLQELLIEGGIIKSRHPYERIVSPDFAQQAIGHKLAS